ncbi:MAG: hypothetical protein OER88_00980 [Planctomycetota bacterium]|nr:hypothetical protein [Planctomycetota bacterium]
MNRLFLLPLLFVLAAPVHAEDEPAAPADTAKKAGPAAPVMDDLSKKLLTTWDEKMTYRLSELGVKTATCKAKVDLQSQMGEMTVNAAYKWDGKRGSLTWDNAMVGAQLAQQGMGVDTFDGHFKTDGLAKGMAGGTFKATDADGTVTIAVTGSKDGYKTITFKDGVLQRFVMSQPVMGKVTDITLSFTYQKIGEKYLVSGWTVALEIPGMGPFQETTTFTIGKVGEHHVWTSAKAASAMGTRATTFEWKLNPPAEEAPAKAPPADGAK